MTFQEERVSSAPSLNYVNLYAVEIAIEKSIYELRG